MSKWEINRRTFLRGIGTAIALPMLDAMVPSLRRMSAAAATPSATGAANVSAGGIPKRMAFVYVPQGKNMADWTPSTVGADYQLPMILEPLAAHPKDFTVLTGLAHNQANGLDDGGGDHASAAATFLTAHQPRKTSGADIESSISIDQVAATLAMPRGCPPWSSRATRARPPARASPAIPAPINSTSPGNPPSSP